MSALLKRTSSARQPRAKVDYVTDLDTPLLTLPQNEKLTLRHLHNGIHAFGGIGSGKTSSFDMLARQMLHSNMGGLVLCAKQNESGRWVNLARECGRSESVILFGNEQAMQFNFLQYELLRPNGGGQTENIVELFLTMLEAVNSQQGGEGAGNMFWQNQAKLFLTHMFNLLIAGTGTLTIDDMTRFLSSLPRSQAQLNDNNFKRSSFVLRIIREAAINPKMPRRKRDAIAACEFFGQRVIMYDDKTFANIMATLDSMLFPFQTGKLRELFCNRLDFVPEMAIEHGCIIIMDLSVEGDKFIGTLSNIVMKYMFQQAALARAKRDDMRSAFLWVDEAANFYTRQDNQFQSLCRESRICSVYMAQNLGSYFGAVHGQNARENIDNFLGNFGVKLFFSNMDTATNKWASETIGRTMQRRHSANWNESHSTGSAQSAGSSYGSSEGTNKGGSTGYNHGWSSNVGSSTSTHGFSDGKNWGENSSTNKSKNHSHSVNHNSSQGMSEGWQEVLEVEVEPNAFVSGLRTGGRDHGCMVDGIMVRAGGFAGGRKFLPVSFKQS